MNQIYILAGLLRGHGSLTPCFFVLIFWGPGKSLYTYFLRHFVESVGVWGVCVVLSAIRSMYNQSGICFHILGTKSCLYCVQVEFHQVSDPACDVHWKDSRCSLGVKGVWFGMLRVLSLLFGDDWVLLASSGHDLEYVLGQFAIKSEVAWLTFNSSYSKATIPTGNEWNAPFGFG